jgi:hypothetical protein
LRPVVLRSIAYCRGKGRGQGFVTVGSNAGVFMAAGPGFADWTRLGAGLPNAPVFRLQCSDADGILLAGTLGRGAWTLDLTKMP